MAAIAASPSPSPSTPDPTSTPSTLVQTVQQGTTEAFTTASKFLTHLYHVGLILAIALIILFVGRRTVARFATSISEGKLNKGLSRFENLGLDPEAVERRSQRAATLGSVLRSVVNAVVFSITVVLIMGELGLNLAPILASAGIVGVAVGFGAQSIVKDFLSGLFLVLEDQYGVGDVIDLQKDVGVTGTVEYVGLRSTRVRDVEGNLWHVRNGNVNQVGNHSQGWSRILLDVTFGFGVDVEVARQAMLDAAMEYATDEEHAGDVLEDPAVWGVQDVTSEGVVVRLAVKTKSGVKDNVARALRELLIARFAQRSLVLAGEAPSIVVHSAPRRAA